MAWRVHSGAARTGERSWRPKLAVLIALQLLLVLGVIAFAVTKASSPEPAPKLPGGLAEPTTDRFDAARALATAKLQVDAGQRPAGSAKLREVAEQLRQMLPSGQFEQVPGHKGLRNVVGSIPGSGPAIVIAAHYDTENHPEGFVGANDAAAAVGTVIEIGRVLSHSKRPLGAPPIRLVLFDGEEEPYPTDDFYRDALRGSKAYVAAHAEEVRALVLLDYIGGKNARFPREGSSNEALWRSVRKAAANAGVEDRFPDDVEVSIVDDHTPFLKAGIPAVDLIDWSYRFKDTLEDTYDKLDIRSIDAVGETIVALIDAWDRQVRPAGDGQPATP